MLCAELWILTGQTKKDCNVCPIAHMCDRGGIEELEGEGYANN